MVLIIMLQNYNIFLAYHYEDDSEAGLVIKQVRDLAQSTAFQTLTSQIGSGADESCSGSLTLFNPSSLHMLNTLQEQ
jgi:hypothetical protein